MSAGTPAPTRQELALHGLRADGRAAPRAELVLETTPSGVRLDASSSRAGDAPLRAFRWTARPGGPEELHAPDGWEGPRLELEPPRAAGEYVVLLDVVDADGVRDRAGVRFVVDEAGPRPAAADERPAWVERAIVYGVIPWKLGPDGLRSVTARLDDLAELGVTALWLSPIALSPPGDYGYAVVDYFAVDPRHGSEADLRELVEAAHARGLRVLLDVVPNHSSAQHPFFLEAEREGPGSRFWPLYDRGADGSPTRYFDWTHLPNLNYSDPRIERFMIEALAYWVREHDVDGFRIDAVWGVKQRRPDVLARLPGELRRVKPDVMLLAEAGARDPWYAAHDFDAAYDWDERLGGWAWEGVFDDVSTLPERLDAALYPEGSVYPRERLVFRFLNNNDTGPRFVSVHGVPRTRVAAAMLLTLPGVPCIYAGDELGAEYLPYGEQTPISWHDAAGLRPWYRRLIALRATTPALRARDMTPVAARPRSRGLYAYVRDGDGATPALVVLNYGDEACEARLELPERFARLGAVGLRDALNEEHVEASAGEGLSVPMPGVTARVLVEETA